MFRLPAQGRFFVKHYDLVTVNDRITCIDYPIGKIIFFHAVKEIIRILTKAFYYFSFYGMGTTGIKVSFKEGFVFILFISLMWQTVFLHFQRVVIKYFKR